MFNVKSNDFGLHEEERLEAHDRVIEKLKAGSWVQCSTWLSHLKGHESFWLTTYRSSLLNGWILMGLSEHHSWPWPYEGTVIIYHPDMI